MMYRSSSSRGYGWIGLTIVVLVVSGCMKGPNYTPPTAQTEGQWLGADDPRISMEPDDHREWWSVFNDPVLISLVETAYRQNLSLQIAGLRILQARAVLGIASGEQYPQTQFGAGVYSYNRQSENTANVPLNTDFSDWQFGFDADWELDVWGRFRRGIEAANAELQASIADYDDILVSLTAEVASTYVQIRTLERRLALARDNVEIQQQSLQIVQVRFQSGATSKLDVEEALSQLRDTESTIPELETALRQAQHALSVLLGTPPRDLREMLGASQPIPTAPDTVAVGMPAELLRRRPDVQRTEREAAAQSAKIGIAVSDLYPQFFLSGGLSVQAEDFADLAKASSVAGFIGPSLSWPIFNYGRIRNNIRLQDALFQESVVTYQNTVLLAAQEVEDAIVAFTRTQDQVRLLEQSVAATKRRLDLARVQYREGSATFTRVLEAQASLVNRQDRLATGRGSIPLNLIAIYKALGGGWQIRVGKDFVPQETQEVMRARTNWGKILTQPKASEIKPVRLFTPVDW